MNVHYHVPQLNKANQSQEGLTQETCLTHQFTLDPWKANLGKERMVCLTGTASQYCEQPTNMRPILRVCVCV